MVCGQPYESHAYRWTLGPDGWLRRECADCGLVHARETSFVRAVQRRLMALGWWPP